MCWGIGLENTRTLSDTQGYYYCDFIFFFLGGQTEEDIHTLSNSPGGKPHILTIIFFHSGAMWALGLVVLLVTVAGVLALLVYVLKW